MKMSTNQSLISHLSENINNTLSNMHNKIIIILYITVLQLIWMLMKWNIKLYIFMEFNAIINTNVRIRQCIHFVLIITFKYYTFIITWLKNNLKEIICNGTKTWILNIILTKRNSTLHYIALNWKLKIHA